MKNRPIKKSDLRVGLLVVSTNQPDANIWTVADFCGNSVLVLGDGYEQDGVYKCNHASGWSDYSIFYHPTVEQIQNYCDEGRRIVTEKMVRKEFERLVFIHHCDTGDRYVEHYVPKVEEPVRSRVFK